eukprot:TRINITY_DN102_c2_g2_i1.p1 TRINITY_DN102_c2_g2~~TRINITY_DN102_c2_g2_i1.p1  ORF type:complete len:748 (+),score=176.21 TRINITY_DN102_c2_g2_i1:602-2845(+)
MDTAAQYLIDEGMCLSALEMYQELKERGVENKLLRDFLEKKTGLSLEEGAAGSGQTEGEEDKLKKLKSAVQSLNEDLKKQEAREVETLTVLAERLPTVISNVRTSGKESLIQIILTLIEHHPAPVMRSSLLFHYVTLFKRPDAEQRDMIIDGLKQLMLKLCSTAPNRIETELLPAVRSITEYRYPEHRVLAVEATQSLYPHLRSRVQKDIVETVFPAWLTDTAGAVREAVLRAVADVVREDNVTTCAGLLVHGLQDVSKKVQKTALQVACPVVSSVAATHRCLTTTIMTPLIAALSSQEHVAISLTALNHCLRIFVPLLKETVPPGLGSAEDGLDTLLKRVIDRKVKGMWVEAEWLTSVFITMTVGAMRHTDCATELLLTATTSVTKVLAEPVCQHFFNTILEGDSETWELVPGFVRYYSSVEKVDKDDEEDCLFMLVKDGLLQTVGDANWLGVIGSALCRAVTDYDSVQGVVVSALWDLITNEREEVRCHAASCLAILLREKAINQQVCTRRALPALMTLSTDPSAAVRLQAAVSTFALATQIAAPDLLEKIGGSLTSSFTFVLSDLEGSKTCLQALRNHLNRMQCHFSVTFVLPLLDTSVQHAASESQMGPVVPLLCDCIKTLVSHCSGHDLPLHLGKIIASLKVLGKGLAEPGMKSCVSSLVRECEAADDHKKDRFLSKFRELLEEPNTQQQPPGQAELDGSGPHSSPKVGHPPPNQDEQPANPTLSKNKSLLSKAKMRFFGES